ncbi:MAG TPA: hypothetical protein VIY26_08315 [Acidimicrobiales bacterium]
MLLAPAGATTTSWSLMSGPSVLSGQSINWASDSCVSATFCMAVGPSRTLSPPIAVEPSELWNGTAWSYVSMPVPSVPADPASVSCVSSSFCVAVGYAGAVVFADQWNGSKWSATTVPQPPDGLASILFSVSCVSPTACEAVGQDGTAPLAEQWNGSSWTIVATQNPDPTASGILLGVSCTNQASCWAVGVDNSQPAAEQFNGSAWTSAPVPAPSGTSELTSVSCVTSTFCEAVGPNSLAGSLGGETPLIETWEGSAWAIASSPVAAVPGQSQLLAGVSCATVASCVAVGEGATSALVLDYQDGQWVGAPSPAGASATTGAFPIAVSCMQSWDCVTEGTANATTGVELFFAESPLTSPAMPGAVIASPSTNATYSLNQVVATSFSCSDGAGGPGIASCTDSVGSTSPGLLDTSAYGVHSYAVTATSTDGLSATTSVSYTVAAPPTVSITSPASGGTYTLNQSVLTAFGCTEGAGGPGISGCQDSNNQTSPGLLNTSSLGTHTYSVNAASGDGLSGQASISYTVVSPNVAPAITSNPVSQTGYVGTTLTFTASASGTPTPSVQWQVSTDKGASWANYTGSGATSTSVTSASLTTSETGWKVRAVFTNVAGTATTSAATITVLKDVAPRVTTQPSNETVSPGSTASFKAAASGAPTPSVQWRVSTNGGATWTAVSGATSTTLSFVATAAENGRRYEAVFTNPGGSATTKVVTLRT